MPDGEMQTGSDWGRAGLSSRRSLTCARPEDEYGSLGPYLHHYLGSQANNGNGVYSFSPPSLERRDESVGISLAASVRLTLLRVQAFKQRGLAGIAPPKPTNCQHPSKPPPECCLAVVACAVQGAQSMRQNLCVSARVAEYFRSRPKEASLRRHRHRHRLCCGSQRFRCILRPHDLVPPSPSVCGPRAQHTHTY
jgi:hypothetical protein